MTLASTMKISRRRQPVVIGAGILLVVVMSAAMLIKSFIENSSEPKKRMVQQISLIKPPEPPPPEVKPPEERPPDPQEEIEQDQPPPEPMNTDAQPPGIGGAGYGNGDTSFGGGGAWAGDGSRFSGYLGGLKNGIHDELDRNAKLRKGEYMVVVAIWLAHDGRVNRLEVIGSSGNPDRDALMKKVLSNARFDEPPSDMPQPVKLRISSR